ncbi:hypothetical protein GCM10009411_10520 [Shewanella litoralis]|uniref:ThiC-associated domain-containing protein n=1 Tax=Shewanella litoralis TaxID=2282700 RepID=A0ABQ2R620_9GAMM|nr:hypothetical protein GCM10009411_10520 [Shewanella litoralis]
MSHSNRRQTRAKAQQFIDTLKPLQHPNSKKVYLQGSRPDLLVAMRQIHQTSTRTGGTDKHPITETNPAIMVYDCAGPYSDPHADIDVRRGLVPLRRTWI